MSFFIRLTPEEKTLVQVYADMHSISVSEAFKRSLFEKIEDEYDSKIADEALAKYLQEPETVSHEDVGKMFGIN